MRVQFMRLCSVYDKGICIGTIGIFAVLYPVCMYILQLSPLLHPQMVLLKRKGGDYSPSRQEPQVIYLLARHMHIHTWTL